MEFVPVSNFQPTDGAAASSACCVDRSDGTDVSGAAYAMSSLNRQELFSAFVFFMRPRIKVMASKWSWPVRLVGGLIGGVIGFMLLFEILLVFMMLRQALPSIFTVFCVVVLVVLIPLLSLRYLSRGKKKTE